MGVDVNHFLFFFVSICNTSIWQQSNIQKTCKNISFHNFFLRIYLSASHTTGSKTNILRELAQLFSQKCIHNIGTICDLQKIRYKDIYLWMLFRLMDKWIIWMKPFHMELHVSQSFWCWGIFLSRTVWKKLIWINALLPIEQSRFALPMIWLLS